MAYGSSQGRDLIRVVDAILHQSHSNTRSKPCLQPHHSLRQHQILNPLMGARTHVLKDSSQVHYHWATVGTLFFFNSMNFIIFRVVQPSSQFNTLVSYVLLYALELYIYTYTYILKLYNFLKLYIYIYIILKCTVDVLLNMAVNFKPLEFYLCFNTKTRSILKIQE